MNIGIVTTWFERGAAYVSRQYKATLEQQFNVFIYARGGEKDIAPGPDWDGSRVTRGKEPDVAIETAIDQADFSRWVTENAIDIVLFNEQRWWLPVIWCRQLGIKVGAYVDYYTERTVRLFNVYDFLLCNTRRHYSVFSWHPQCFYFPWGTNLNTFKPANSYLTINRELTFFHSAGMSPGRKGTDLLLEAFSRLSPPSRLVIHSQVDLEPVFPELSPIISRLQHENRLVVTVQTVPAPGLYHLGDVYVYPSRLDGIGLSLAEAAACGLPLIATDSPPMSEFVSDTNGQLVSVDAFVPRAFTMPCSSM
jgi:1,2-diacylglycerol 3-alpha-glucosyltransferase